MASHGQSSFSHPQGRVRNAIGKTPVLIFNMKMTIIVLYKFVRKNTSFMTDILW